MRSILDGLRLLQDRPARLVVGLISGTSADAIDAAVCWIPGAVDLFDPVPAPA